MRIGIDVHEQRLLVLDTCLQPIGAAYHLDRDDQDCNHDSVSFQANAHYPTFCHVAILYMTVLAKLPSFDAISHHR
tara:strand:- start:2473 stop:2700 length:228 start_codon:yes stop_codon:yes gene_type:complete